LNLLFLLTLDKAFLTFVHCFIVINVTIATKNLRFLYALNEILSNIKEINTNHILPNEPIPKNTDIIITTEIEKDVFKKEKI